MKTICPSGPWWAGLASVLATGLALAGCAPMEQTPDAVRNPAPRVVEGGMAQTELAQPADPTPTLVLAPLEKLRLLENTGLTLQWIDWDQRGTLDVVERDGVLYLSGRQEGVNGALLELDGQVREIGSDYFVFDGTISMINAPDRGRRCVENRANWRFAVTQGRKYWRLRTFEWCDGLTDYIDIYF